MVRVKAHRNYGTTSTTPRRPFEKERLDLELKLLGDYGLRCKREIWRVQLALAKIRKAARKLLTLDDHDPKRKLEGDALIRRLTRLGLLNEDEKGLDDVLRMTTRKLLDRRLQNVVVRQGYAKTVHHARTLIRQRHIRVGKQLVNVPSFLVRNGNEGFIDYALRSPFSPNGRPGRLARKKGAGAEE